MQQHQKPAFIEHEPTVQHHWSLIGMASQRLWAMSIQIMLKHVKICILYVSACSSWLGVVVVVVSHSSVLTRNLRKYFYTHTHTCGHFGGKCGWRQTISICPKYISTWRFKSHFTKQSKQFHFRKLTSKAPTVGGVCLSLLRTSIRRRQKRA